MRVIPKPGQWFRLGNQYPSHPQFRDYVYQAIEKYRQVYSGGDFERLVANRYSDKGVMEVDMPVLNFSQFIIITDPEEEAMLCLTYLGV